MKNRLPHIVACALLFGRLCAGQTNAPVGDWKPASSNQPGREYPKVNSEGRVTFRIVAPEATQVGVTFRDSSPFVKGEDGAWYGTTRPLDEGFHYTGGARTNTAGVPRAGPARSWTTSLRRTRRARSSS